jgi:hypothetical protein
MGKDRKRIAWPQGANGSIVVVERGTKVKE